MLGKFFTLIIDQTQQFLLATVVLNILTMSFLYIILITPGTGVAWPIYYSYKTEKTEATISHYGEDYGLTNRKEIYYIYKANGEEYKGKAVISSVQNSKNKKETITILYKTDNPQENIIAEKKFEVFNDISINFTLAVLIIGILMVFYLIYRIKQYLFIIRRNQVLTATILERHLLLGITRSFFRRSLWVSIKFNIKYQYQGKTYTVKYKTHRPGIYGKIIQNDQVQILIHPNKPDRILMDIKLLGLGYIASPV